MNRTIANLSMALAATVVLLSAQADDQAAPPKSTYFERATITINDRARADGFLRVRVQPENGEAHEATITIERRMSENHIAKAMADALEAALGKEFEVDRSGGENVKIRKANRKTNANFSVEVTFNSPGFSISIDD